MLFRSRSRTRRLFVGLAITMLGCTTVTVAASAQSTARRAQPQKVSLSGVTLNFGIDGTIAQTLLQASGQLRNLPYQVNWSTFTNGPTAVAAELGGSVDVTYLGNAPQIVAQAANEPITAVAVEEPRLIAKQSQYAIVVPPSSPIKTVSDLSGKNLGLAVGTIETYVAVRIVTKAGLKWNQIDPVNLTTASAANAALEQGSIQADVTTLGNADALVNSGAARILTTGAGLGVDYITLVVPNSLLLNKQKTAAVQDLVQRIAKAFKWASSHLTQYAPVYAQFAGLTTAAGVQYVHQVQMKWVPISRSIKASYQQEANVLDAQGVITHDVSVKSEFDTRFNSLVAAIAGVTAS